MMGSTAILPGQLQDTPPNQLRGCVTGDHVIVGGERYLVRRLDYSMTGVSEDEAIKYNLSRETPEGTVSIRSGFMGEGAHEIENLIEMLLTGDYYVK